jgi:hypothetical protein
MIYMKYLPLSARVEAGWNICTVALGVVGRDEKRPQCLGVQLGHGVPGGYKYRHLTLQVADSVESESIRYGYESRGTRIQE